MRLRNYIAIGLTLEYLQSVDELRTSRQMVAYPCSDVHISAWYEGSYWGTPPQSTQRVLPGAGAGIINLKPLQYWSSVDFSRT